jgi:lysophospholipase L1-like esterase
VLSLTLTMAIGLVALAISIGLRASAAALREWRNRIILLTITVTLSALAAEAATRIIFRDVTTSSDNGGFFSIRWSRGGHVQTHEHGFRERPFSMAKAAGTYRIVVLGDSFTFGNGLEAADRYSDRLQQFLSGTFEVLNFGTPGANTPQHLHTLRSRVLPADPDFVLLQWFINDIEGDSVEGRPVIRPLIPTLAIHNWLQAHSALYTVANMRWGEIQVTSGVAGSYPDYLQVRAGDPNSADARRDADTLKKIIAETRGQGRGIGIVLFPDPGPDMGDSYPFAYLHDRVMAVCRETNIPCLDLRKDYAAVSDRRSLWVSPFDHHPSAKANEIAAVKILETFRRYWGK